MENTVTHKRLWQAGLKRLKLSASQNFYLERYLIITPANLRVNLFQALTTSLSNLLFIFLVLLQFSWRRGSKDSRGQGFKGLFFKDFISAFNILSISAMSLLVYPVRKQNHKICNAS